MEKVIPNGERCWTWRGTINDKGYGVVYDNTRKNNVRAHRALYELVIGPVPDGFVLDHLCRNRACVNPWHLEPVTHGENVLRGVGHSAQNAAKTHCIHGHPFDDENTYWHKRGRHCRACGRMHSRIHWRRKAEADRKEYNR